MCAQMLGQVGTVSPAPAQNSVELSFWWLVHLTRIIKNGVKFGDGEIPFHVCYTLLLSHTFKHTLTYLLSC